MVSDDQVFDSMAGSEPEVDYTGLNAAHYIDKYTNRPEDQGDLQAIQSMLSTAGIVAPPADMINAAIYAVQGEWGMAALSAGAVVPILGDMHKAKKSGEKMITLYRGVPKWFPGEMVKNGKFIGGKKFLKQVEEVSEDKLKGWKSFTPEFQNEDWQSLSKAGLWVSESKRYAFDFVSKYPNSMVLEFKVPESIVKSQLTKTGQYKGKVLGFFEEGLHKKYLINVHKSQVKLSPLQEKLNKLRDNPNIGENLARIQKDNIKRYNK